MNRPSHTVGTGETPNAAVRDLAPDQESDHVALVNGLQDIPDCEDPSSVEETSNYELTVYFEELPAKQWRIEVTSMDGKWRAVRIGSKRV